MTSVDESMDEVEGSGSWKHLRKSYTNILNRSEDEMINVGHRTWRIGGKRSSMCSY